MIQVGMYDVRYDDTTNEYVVNDRLGQRGEQRFDTITDAAGWIEFDMHEVDVSGVE